MTVQSYINSLISDNFNIAKIRLTGYYQFSGSTIDTVSGPVTVEIFSHEDESLCEFFDKDGNLVARAKSFASVL